MFRWVVGFRVVGRAVGRCWRLRHLIEPRLADFQQPTGNGVGNPMIGPMGGDMRHHAHRVASLTQRTTDRLSTSCSIGNSAHLFPQAHQLGQAILAELPISSLTEAFFLHPIAQSTGMQTKTPGHLGNRFPRLQTIGTARALNSAFDEPARIRRDKITGIRWGCGQAHGGAATRLGEGRAQRPSIADVAYWEDVAELRAAKREMKKAARARAKRKPNEAPPRKISIIPRI